MTSNTRRTPIRESEITARRGIRNNKLYPQLSTEDDSNGGNGGDHQIIGDTDSQPLVNSDSTGEEFDNVDDTYNYGTQQTNSVFDSYISNILNKFTFILLILSLIAFTSSYVIFDGKQYVDRISDYVRGSDASLTQLNRWLVFENRLKLMETEYSDVFTINDIKVMQKAVYKVMNSSVWRSSPAVILMIGSRDQTRVLKCIANEFVAAISEAYNESFPLAINGKHTDWYRITDSFHNNFQIDKKHSIIVEHIESISSSDIMALHQFTDHENAKFPDSVIVLTAHNLKKISIERNAKLKDMDEIATQLFELLWKDSMSEDQRGGLISRFTPSVVVILHDDSNRFKCNVNII